MAHLLALLGNDPSQIHCQLHRMRGPALLGPRDSVPADETLGLGHYVDDAPLVAKRPGDVGTHDLIALTEGMHSPALLAASRRAGGRFDEDATDPFRFRQWLFAMDGALEDFADLRERLLEELPDLISRQIRGSTDREHVFALFLRHLRDRGRLDDPNAPAPDVARCLAETVRMVDRLERDQGGTRHAPLAMIATNGRSLVAARRGRPLFYRLQEGAGDCAACEVEDDSDPRAAAHRRARAVVLASEPGESSHFIEVPDGSVVAVGRALDITVASL